MPSRPVPTSHRLADVRYEPRDTQHLLGLLADAGVTAPRRIGVTGTSYGAGQSLMLATLRDRVAMPDGTTLVGRAVGIDTAGRLEIDTDGERRAVGAGDVVHLRSGS